MLCSLQCKPAKCEKTTSKKIKTSDFDFVVLLDLVSWLIPCCLSTIKEDMFDIERHVWVSMIFKVSWGFCWNYSETYICIYEYIVLR